MSLHEAVNLIADSMEEEVEELAKSNEGSQFVCRLLKSYAKQLRIAVKAAGNPPQAFNPMMAGAVMLGGGLAGGMGNHRDFIEQAKGEFAGKRGPEGKIDRDPEGEFDGQMIMCKGGPSDGVHINVPPSMPQGAKTVSEKGVYVLTGSELVYDAAETAKWLQQTFQGG